MARQDFGKRRESAADILLPVRMPVGTRIMLTGDHPWAGEVGVIVDYQKLGLFPTEPARPRIQMDNGQDCFATHPERHLRKL